MYVSFYKGLSSSYNADTHSNSIYLCSDTNEVYIFGLKIIGIPIGGYENLILLWTKEGKAQWSDIATVLTGLEEILAYGVLWNTTVSDPHLTRIGNMSLHKTLPIQSLLKGCIALGGLVMYWLDENDWRWRKNPIALTMTLAVADSVYTIIDDLFADNRYKDQWLKINNIACKVTSINTGSKTATITPDEDITAGEYDVELGSVLNGYDGTVRVYCPNFYIKSYANDDIRKVYISTVKIDDSWTYQHEILIDAYRSTVLNTVPENMGYLSTLPVNSAISVVNTETYCRGPSNQSDLDANLATLPFNTALGKPRVSLPRSTMRTYCRNAGSEMLSYEQYKNIFYWLWVIEYANFNSQEAYNDQLTSEGYHQGGMGSGVTTDVYETNVYYGLIPCGYCNEFGNGTGIKTATFSNSKSVEVPRWRGFDNPFGDILTNLDGIIIDANNHGNNMDYVYTCNDPSKFGDTLTEDYVKTAESIHLDGYVKAFDLGETANIIASEVGGSITTYMCDCHLTGNKNTTLRAVLVGGRAYDGALAGLGALSSGLSVSYSSTPIGFRSVSVL